MIASLAYYSSTWYPPKQIVKCLLGVRQYWAIAEIVVVQTKNVLLTIPIGLPLIASRLTLVE